MAEKKSNRLKRTPSIEGVGKQYDQVLRGADMPAVTEQAKKQISKTSAGQKSKTAQTKPRSASKTNSAQKKPFHQQKPPNKGGKKAGVPQNSAAKRAQNQQTRPAGKVQSQKKQASAGKNKTSLKVYFLGGLNEIGKNFTVFECNNDMIIVDCGLAFPDEDMLGVDIVIPDFAFVEENANKIRGIIITHGHEDHIGALPYLLKKINVPVFGTALTIGLIAVKLKEHGLAGLVKTTVAPAGSRLKFGCMDVELIHVNHSISDAVALAISTPAGTVVHTGDFKIDFTPEEGEMIDLTRFAQLGSQGVLALFADSTNAERPGYTQTEKKVGETFDGLFAKAEGKRIIVATFASNISRVQQIINCAHKYGRKVALSGRSMLNVMGIASELGYLNVPSGVLIDLNMINRYDNGDVVLITTGSQGETMSALTRMAYDEHRQVELSENDFIIISARPIPGNEKAVGAVVDEIMKKGSTVVYESMYEVHVSGHACQEELKLIHGLVKPKYFIPVHGEQKHLRKHAGVAMTMGIPQENIFIGNIGNVIEINKGFMRRLEDVTAGGIMVDGIGVGDVGSIVLRDRKHLSQDGLIIAVCTISKSTGRMVSGPDIVSRGFVYVRESDVLIDEAKKIVYNAIEGCAKGKTRDWTNLKQKVKEELSRYVYGQTRRSPMILPVIMEV